MKQEVFRMERVTRAIKGEIILDNMNLHIFAGEIMGFIAAEAKGKQELLELLEKNLPILYGRIYLNGKMINSYAGSKDLNNKIYIIKQQSQLVNDLTVADNIFVLRRGFKKYLINKKILAIQVEQLLSELQIEISSDKTISQLSALERCVVELVRAKLMDCRLIVLNDLPNFLNYHELMIFQRMIRHYCNLGFAFLYIGNHHEDIFKISDRTILFSNGTIKKIFDSDEMDDTHMAPYTVSFGLSEKSLKPVGSDHILEFIEVKGKTLNLFSLSVRRRECVAILDTDHTIMDDWIKIMTGGERIQSGVVRLNHHDYTAEMAERFLCSKVALIQENPIQTMVFDDMTYMDNLTFLLDQKLNQTIVKKKYLFSVKKEYEKLVGSNIKLKDLKNVAPEVLYELVYYRIHLYHPEVVICKNPFAFGDMGCRNKILDLIQNLKNKGITVIILMVNISDSLQVADRLMIAANGAIRKEFGKEEFSLVRR